MTLQPREDHRHGLSNRDFDPLFATDAPIIFVFHSYPRLIYWRSNNKNLHVREYREEGTTTASFDMVVRNDLDRFHLVSDVIDRVPKLVPIAAYAKQAVRHKHVGHQIHCEVWSGSARDRGLDPEGVPDPGDRHPQQQGRT
jgi:xylulose-5-phosphate/fructose-6-phosphate phosphoketolase